MTTTSTSISSVVVGVDDSDTSHHALRWGAELASRADAALNVSHTWFVPASINFTAADMVTATMQVVEEQAVVTVDKAIAAAGIDTDVTKSIDSGDAGVALCSTAGPDSLIVIGRTGQGRRRGIARASEILLGSTARYCIHHAEGPVMTIPEQASLPPDITRVVVGVDGSPASLRALEWATTAFPGETEVTALFTFIPWVADPLAPIDWTWHDAAVEGARKELASWVASACGERADEVATLVQTGDARSSLTSPELGADVIVVGTRGRTGVARFVLGSVADHVVRHARCPVVVLPPEG